MSTRDTVAAVFGFSFLAFILEILIVSPDSYTQRAQSKYESDPHASWTCRTVYYVGENSKPEVARSCVCEDAGTP